MESDSLDLMHLLKAFVLRVISQGDAMGRVGDF